MQQLISPGLPRALFSVLVLALLPLALFAQIPQGGVGGRPGAGMNPAQMNIGRFYGKVLDEATLSEPVVKADQVYNEQNGNERQVE